MENKQIKIFACGDIHGNYKGLKQVLERSNFDYNNDVLIQLGDICDGRDEVYECVEELLKISNLIHIRGNHDEPFAEFCQSGIHPWGWAQGGNATAKSYLKLSDKEHLITPIGKEGKYLTALNTDDVPLLHQEFFRTQHYYYVDNENRLFIHGGFNRHFPLKEQMLYTLLWDRDLWNSALSYEAAIKNHSEGLKPTFKIKDNFKEIYIGHTTTQMWGETQFMKAANIYNLDTGAGGSGRVCIMNVDTKEAFYSDLANDLYPEQKGRR